MRWYLDIFRDEQAMQELDSIIGELGEIVDKSFPGLTSDTRDRIVQVMFGLTLVYPDAGEQMVMEKYEEIAQEAVRNNEQWAKEASEVFISSLIRPSYDKAVKAGVDPVDFLRADLGISKEHAKNFVEAFAKEENS